MGWWLDMIFGKSPLQSELDEIHNKVEEHYSEFNSARAELETVHKKVEADHKVLAKLADFNEVQVELNEKVGSAIDNSAAFAEVAVAEFAAAKARLDLLEANVTVHKRVKPKKHPLRDDT